MSPDATVIRDFLEQTWNKRNLAAIDEVFVPGFAAHDPAVPAATDAEGVKQFMAAYLAAFPDLHLTVEDLFAAEDKVTARWTLRGTHKGHFMGVAPTEKQVAVTGITIYRLAGGKITAYWTNWDSSGLLQQLGSVLQTEQAKGA